MPKVSLQESTIFIDKLTSRSGTPMMFTRLGIGSVTAWDAREQDGLHLQFQPLVCSDQIRSVIWSNNFDNWWNFQMWWRFQLWGLLLPSFFLLLLARAWEGHGFSGKKTDLKMKKFGLPSKHLMFFNYRTSAERLKAPATPTYTYSTLWYVMSSFPILQNPMLVIAIKFSVSFWQWNFTLSSYFQALHPSFSIFRNFCKYLLNVQVQPDCWSLRLHNWCQIPTEVSLQRWMVWK